MISTTVGGWRHILRPSGTRFTFCQWSPIEQKLANAGAKTLAFPCFVEFCWAYHWCYCSGGCRELGSGLRRQRRCWQKCNLNMLCDSHMLVFLFIFTRHIQHWICFRILEAFICSIPFHVSPRLFVTHSTTHSCTCILCILRLPFKARWRCCIFSK